LGNKNLTHEIMNTENIIPNHFQEPSFSNAEIKRVIQTLIYFDMFHYPLTAKEVFERCNVSSLSVVESILQYLTDTKLLFEHEVLFVK
jgi:hypothetical protein